MKKNEKNKKRRIHAHYHLQKILLIVEVIFHNKLLHYQYLQAIHNNEQSCYKYQLILHIQVLFLLYVFHFILTL